MKCHAAYVLSHWFITVDHREDFSLALIQHLASIFLLPVCIFLVFFHIHFYLAIPGYNIEELLGDFNRVLICVDCNLINRCRDQLIP